ncbi:MAG: type II toxin-antitoxin system death-on-curing family toxin [Coriobacteriia bacterium]|nr:type II toxin-antitoxin system death-on-curing family toxin [Coriobacteriia bacterium]
MIDVLGEPRWLGRLAVDAIHHDLIATYGGMPGIRDEGLLESALVRPRQAYSYGGSPDIAALAAAYGYGIARNHPYNDGNKRVAFVIMAVFAELNGFEFDAPETDVVTTMIRLASGELDELKLTEWVRAHLRRVHDPAG